MVYLRNIEFDVAGAKVVLVGECVGSGEPESWIITSYRLIE